jgi:hypothetical protein
LHSAAARPDQRPPRTQSRLTGGYKFLTALREDGRIRNQRYTQPNGDPHNLYSVKSFDPTEGQTDKVAFSKNCTPWYENHVELVLEKKRSVLCTPLLHTTWETK